MKQVIFSLGLLLIAVVSARAQNVRVFNNSGCTIDVLFTEYDVNCNAVFSGSATIPVSPVNFVDFPIAAGNSYEVEVVDLWMSGNNIPAVGVGCTAVSNQGPVSSAHCTSVTLNAYSHVSPAPYPPGISSQVVVHL